MNIVFDDGVMLDAKYRQALAGLLPLGNAPLKLNSLTAKTDGSLKRDEGIVFITHLPVDVLKHHILFFENYNDVPQWFFILLNENDHGLTALENAARSCGLKNHSVFYANSTENFENTVEEIAATKVAVKGKALFLSKHKKNWIKDFSELLFGDDESKYEIMCSVNMAEMDAEILLLCGESRRDFENVNIPDNMEPYFVFRFKNELQYYVNCDEFVSELASVYHMTTERVESRLFYIDMEGEKWLSKSFKTAGDEALTDGILIWDSFGLPVSRKEYSEKRIANTVQKSHESFEELKKIVL